MSQVYTFHETVRGHLHIMNEFPCEDFSASFSSEDGKYHIAIVADGHGSKSCFRSNYGSETAVEVAMECLRQFAETILESEETEGRFYKDMFSNPRYRQMTIRRLTDTIIAGWYDRVLENYKNDPPSVEEMGESAEEYEGGKDPAHIYGTTLIAALQMPKCLMLVQQGDGRCDVFYSDGSVDQPIPWDSRCEDTVTTSLCDADAADSFRSCVLDLSEKPVMACYLGCDGVEDAYRDTYEGLGGSHVLMGGVHTFYKDLTCRLAGMEQAEFEDYLETMLVDFSANGRFSRSGSGDDVSVAGIVDRSAILQFVTRYKRDVKRYSLEEDLFWKEDELRGKTRKHGILKKRLEETQSAFCEEQAKQKKLEKGLQQFKLQREELAQKAEQAKQDLAEYRRDSKLASEQFKGKFSRFSAATKRFLEEISAGYSKKEAAYNKMTEGLLEYDKKIAQVEEALQTEAEQVRKLEGKLEEVRAAFEEYDTKYQVINSERVRIENEIAALEEKKFPDSVVTGTGFAEQ